MAYEFDERYKKWCDAARNKSLTEDYKGCVVHVNYEARRDYFSLSDWFDGSTVESFVNGQRL